MLLVFQRDRLQILRQLTIQTILVLLIILFTKTMRKLPNYVMTQCGIFMSGMRFGSRVKIIGMKNSTAGQQLTLHLKKRLLEDIRQRENLNK